MEDIKLKLDWSKLERFTALLTFMKIELDIEVIQVDEFTNDLLIAKQRTIKVVDFEKTGEQENDELVYKEKILMTLSPSDKFLQIVFKALNDRFNSDREQN